MCAGGGPIGVSRLMKMSRGIMTEIEISVVANFKLPNLIFLVGKRGMFLFSKNDSLRVDRRTIQTHRHTSTRAMSLAKEHKTPPPPPPQPPTKAAITDNNCNRCGTLATTIMRSATTGHFWFGSFLFSLLAKRMTDTSFLVLGRPIIHCVVSHLVHFRSFRPFLCCHDQISV